MPDLHLYDKNITVSYYLCPDLNIYNVQELVENFRGFVGYLFDHCRLFIWRA